MATPSPLRVASVPHGHVYVRHLSDPTCDDGIVRLPDPRPAGAPVGAPWWPAVMLDADWLAAHAGEYDLFHLHFGFDAIGPADLQRIVDTLRGLGKPLVYTVHDLRNPHHADRAAHDAALDVLVPAATRLITLTPGAAAEIHRRWGRDARVVLHPHVVEPPTLDRARPTPATPRVGIHLKSMRASLHPLPVLDELVREVPARGWHLEVDVHTDVVTPGEYHHDAQVAARLAELAGVAGVRVHVHDYYSDDELWDYFQGLSLSVLPYRFGTHSGWLEACHDLGTRVLAPHLGFYHEQHEGVLGYRVDERGVPLAGQIAAALDTLADELAAGRPWRADPGERRAQRIAVAAAHREVYAEALAEYAEFVGARR